MERLNKLFDAAANLLSASEKNEINFSSAIKSIENISESIERVESKTKEAIINSTNLASDEIIDKISTELLLKLDKANSKAELAADRYERASRYSVFKISFIAILLVMTVAASIWFLFIKNIPTINEIHELRRERTQLQAEIDKLNKYGYITTCGGEPCISVSENIKYTSQDNKLTYYVIFPRSNKN